MSRQLLLPAPPLLVCCDPALTCLPIEQTVDASIHRAYINLIRNAKRYLYLENQYFLGSAHLWDT
jgi:phosphatidylserine/phosphatidylglycerophosphate/cardiolipin synthase-like enzyme